MAASVTTTALSPAASKTSWISSSAEHNSMKVKITPRATPKLNGTHVTYPLLLSVREASLENTSTPRQPKSNVLGDSSCFGQLDRTGHIFQQSFPVRSYEIGADGTPSIQWFMNNLQEISCNHARNVGFFDDGIGFGSAATRRSKLIWVVTKMHIVVNRYPTWGDVVQIDTWVYPDGKNVLRRDWNVCNKNTGEILAQATSSWVMMNTETRRLSKIPDDMRVEFESVLSNCVPITEEDRRELPKLDESMADNVQNDLTPRWLDLDLHQHVNNVKYISWIFESCISMLESHELVGLTLEYRKECRMGDVLQSMTASANDCIDENRPECVHLLRLDNGTEILRGRTTWRPKQITAHM